MRRYFKILIGLMLCLGYCFCYEPRPDFRSTVKVDGHKVEYKVER